MSLAGRRSGLNSFKGNHATMLVSTAVGADGIEVPVGMLVVCTSLPTCGTELAQLRGGIRDYGENKAAKLLTGGVGINYIPMTSVTPVDGVFPPPCSTIKNLASINLDNDDNDNRWKHGDLSATLARWHRGRAEWHIWPCV
eukprot:g10527.t1